MTFTEKYIRADGAIETAGRQVKRYHINAANGQISEGIQKAANEFLPKLLPKPDGETPPGGWAILHKGAGVPAYLIAYSWTWVNVVECRAAVAGVPELGCDDEDPENFKILDRPWAGCVWELAPLCHERAAWIRHVLQPGLPDLDSYLADMLPDGSTEGRL
ncbi:MAG TPA: hypothetical protein VMC03_07990 [Streptosporangiaceae bacterium]|nr:hypothetical protein [Streptosporangiaceae bacterium]